MTAEYTEDPRSGYFNCWTGRYPTSCVRTLDLYMAWRDGEEFPPLAAFERMTAMSVPAEMLTPALVAEIGRTQVVSLEVTMHDGPEAPGEVFALPRLEALDLSGCGIAALPDRFVELPRLARLDLGHNELAALPASVLGSPSLRDLDLSFNQFSRTPTFPRDSRLERLEMLANPLAVLEADRLPRGLVALGAQTALEEVPASLGELAQLRELALGNRLEVLPDLRGLVALVSLELAGRLGSALFERLPAGLGELRGYGSHLMQLERIPPAIGRMARLRALHLNFEPLTELAAELREVPLARLGLSSTKLADTPTYAHLPGTLQVLELGNVGMTRCPSRLAELVELRELVLAGNRLKEVPAEVRALPRLTKLAIDGQRA